jgi:Predicted transcriptional regulator
MDLRQKIRLPSGKLTSVGNIIGYFYDLSETDITVLENTISKGKVEADQLEKELSISRSTLNMSLNKLHSLGFLEKKRGEVKHTGRPKYIYTVSANVKEKIKKELEDIFKEVIDATSGKKVVTSA